MARKVTENHLSPREERLKKAARFYKRLFAVFMATAIICASGLAYLWFWLERYESHSINGAIRSYLKLVEEENWDKLYDIDIRYFTELNTREAYTEYLRSIYSGKKIEDMRYSFDSSDGLSEYYALHYDYYVMAALELNREDIQGEYHVRTVGTSEQKFFYVLDDDINFTINGVNVTDDLFYSTPDEELPAFAEYDLEYRIPTGKRYVINSLVAEPTVRGTSSDVICVKDYTSTGYYIGHTCDAEQASSFGADMYDTAVAYCKFVTRDGPRYNITSKCYPNTPFYNLVSTFDNSWVTDHDSISFDNVKVYDLISIGENAFIGTISFDYKLIADDITGTYSQAYQMFFVRNGQNYWKLLNMAIISDSVNVETDS